MEMQVTEQTKALQTARDREEAKKDAQLKEAELFYRATGNRG